MPDVSENEKLAAEIRKLSAAILGAVDLLASNAWALSLRIISSAATIGGGIKNIEEILKASKDTDKDIGQLEEGVNKLVSDVKGKTEKIADYKGFCERLGYYAGKLDEGVAEEIKGMEKKALIAWVKKGTDEYMEKIVEKFMLPKCIDAPSPSTPSATPSTGFAAKVEAGRDADHPSGAVGR